MRKDINELRLSSIFEIYECLKNIFSLRNEKTCLNDLEKWSYIDWERLS